MITLGFVRLVSSRALLSILFVGAQHAAPQRGNKS
jgi:hypothetical protein